MAGGFCIGLFMSFGTNFFSFLFLIASIVSSMLNTNLASAYLNKQQHKSDLSELDISPLFSSNSVPNLLCGSISFSIASAQASIPALPQFSARTESIVPTCVYLMSGWRWRNWELQERLGGSVGLSAGFGREQAISKACAHEGNKLTKITPT